MATGSPGSAFVCTFTPGGTTRCEATAARSSSAFVRAATKAASLAPALANGAVPGRVLQPAGNRRRGPVGQSDAAVLEKARESMVAGATWLIWGPNVWQRKSMHRWNSWPASKGFWRSIPATGGSSASAGRVRRRRRASS
jgi:hypothetical protein